MTVARDSNDYPDCMREAYAIELDQIDISDELKAKLAGDHLFYVAQILELPEVSLREIISGKEFLELHNALLHNAHFDYIIYRSNEVSYAEGVLKLDGPLKFSDIAQGESIEEYKQRLGREIRAMYAVPQDVVPTVYKKNTSPDFRLDIRDDKLVLSGTLVSQLAAAAEGAEDARNALDKIFHIATIETAALVKAESSPRVPDF